jgi:hypothetical protein
VCLTRMRSIEDLRGSFEANDILVSWLVLHKRCAIRGASPTFLLLCTCKSACTHCIHEMSEARVAKRKTHTKSRKGCFQCKQRHSKVRLIPAPRLLPTPSPNQKIGREFKPCRILCCSRPLPVFWDIVLLRYTLPLLEADLRSAMKRVRVAQTVSV